MVGLRKAFSRVAVCATLAGMLAGYAGAQTPIERIKALPRATDSDIAQMLTTRNDQAVNHVLSLSYRDVITVFAERAGPAPDRSSEFYFLKPRKGDLPKIKKKTYPQYGNPLGVFQPTNLIELSDEELSDTPSGRFYITSFVSSAIDMYERELERLRQIAVTNGIPAEEYIRQFRMDTPIPTIDGVSLDVPVGAIRTYLPIGAVKEGMLADLRPIDGHAVARIAFTFQPDGKEPLKCKGALPYHLSEGKRVFRSKDAVLQCEFDGVHRRILTPWVEERIANAKRTVTPRSVSIKGFCTADCTSSGSGGGSGSQFPSGFGDLGQTFGDTGPLFSISR